MTKFLSSEPLHDPRAAPVPAASTEVKCTTCYMCACRCGIRVHLRDGGNGPEVRYIEGNPEHPLNQGVICAKGSAGIMKQYSPARLTQPLRRKPGSERGAGEFEPISWEEVFTLLSDRLARLRATDPKQFALFTGRDQMQALTGLFARQFGTPNYAAHGGFCSVNMAAGMIYSIGGSFWEFGGPDLERARLFVMIGTAEDHHSNPLKMALGKFKRGGGRFIAINPIRTGYAAIADEWIPIKPGTDGALLLALIHELIEQDLVDHEFVARFTNGSQLVNLDESSDDFGMMLRNPDGDILNPKRPHNFWWWDRASNRPVADHAEGSEPALTGRYTMPDGTLAYTRDGSFQKDAQGVMVTSSGFPVQPQVTIPPDTVSLTIGRDGVVSALQAGQAAPTQIGQLQLATFVNTGGLQSVGENLYVETASSGTPTPNTPGTNGAGLLNQGFVETSNVNVVEELVSMIETQRAYEVNSKMIQATDEMMKNAAQTL